MSWLALALALIALATAILDVRAAVVLLVTAATLAVAALLRGHGVRVGTGALILVLAGAVVTGWEFWELRRPAATAAPDTTPYGRPGQDREVLLPLTIDVTDVQRLALLEFEADPIYEGLEPQLIDRGHERGYRIIAYRHDGYVDHYDDLTLSPDPDEESKVTGKGRLHYRHLDLGGPTIERDDDGRARIAFGFTDIEGRTVRAHIQEHTTKRSVPLNLLAPVGLSSVEPDYFPLFVLNDFEFLRLRGTEFDVTIDGQDRPLTGFPVPMPLQGQRRSFAKYSVDTDIVGVFPTTVTTAPRVRTTGDAHRDGEVAYLFSGDALERLLFRGTEIVFAPALDLSAAGEGRMTITSYPDRGVIAGPYAVHVDGGTTRVEIGIDDVKVPRQRGLLYRLIVNESAVFGTWPKAYSYQATIDRDTGAIDAHWTNARPGGE
ncbi:MAG TPA: hypothetical protein GXZ30_11150 [Propionibacterium sp.]|nr:hypothetical protein [Propionibacterium sp.]